VEAQRRAHRERAGFAQGETEKPNSPVILKGKAALVKEVESCKWNVQPVVSAGNARYSVQSGNAKWCFALQTGWYRGDLSQGPSSQCG